MKKNFDKTQHIIILGNSGFIGKKLEKYLYEKITKDTKIIGMSFPQIDLTNKHNTKLMLENLFDLNSIVILCAGVKRQIGDSIDTFLQNINMSANVCKVLQEKPVKKFIFFSSAAVYGEDVQYNGINENTPACPKSYYGTAKFTSECLLRKTIDDKDGNSLVILRPPLVYGPNDTSFSYGPSGFINSAIKKQPITLWEDGSELREFVFVDDLIKIIYNIIVQDVEVSVLNIATGKSHSYQDVIKIVSNLVDYKVKINSRQRTKEKVDHKFSNELLLKILPEFNFTNLEEGIRKTFESEYQRFKGGTE